MQLERNFKEKNIRNIVYNFQFLFSTFPVAASILTSPDPIQIFCLFLLTFLLTFILLFHQKFFPPTVFIQK